MKTRSPGPELLDVETPPRTELVRLAWWLAFVNRWLGGTRAVARHLEGLPEHAIVLDVGSGAGDVPRALARRYGFRPVALDLTGTFFFLAPDLPRVRGDARRLPFRTGSVDAAISTHVLHHLSEDDAVVSLRELARVARRRVVVNDLLRRWRALAWIRLLTIGANRFTRHDGPMSVRRGFTLEEAASLARRAGLPWLRARETFGHRFTLAGEPR